MATRVTSTIPLALTTTSFTLLTTIFTSPILCLYQLKATIAIINNQPTTDNYDSYFPVVSADPPSSQALAPLHPRLLHLKYAPGYLNTRSLSTIIENGAIAAPVVGFTIQISPA